MKLIVGNWKMYPATFADAKKIFLSHKKNAQRTKRTKTIVCAPAIFLYPLALLRGNSKSFLLGAQNAFWENEGARTGEISPQSVASLGAQYLILGHSERRALGETDAEIAKKCVSAAANKLTVILCVGEHARDNAGEYFGFVREQLRSSLAGFPKNAIKRLVIAYEPIWAIGTKAVRAATPEDFHEMSILIRRQLVEQFGKKDGFAVPVLYGGSVDERNAEGFLREGGANGLLVGRISLDPQKFGAIIALADTIK